MILLLILTFIVVLGYFTYTFYHRTKEAAIRKAEADIVNASFKIDDFLRKSLYVVDTTALNVEYMMKNGVTTEVIRQYLVEQTKRYVKDIDSSYTGLYGYFRGTYLDGNEWVPEADYEPMKRPWYLKAAENPEKACIVSPYFDVDTKKIIISGCRMLYDHESVFVIDITLNEVKNFATEFHTGGYGYGFIIADTGLIVSHADVSQLGINYLTEERRTTAENAELIRTVLSSNGQLFEKRIKGARYIVCSHQVHGGWYAVVMIDKKKLGYSICGLIARTMLVAFCILMSAGIFIVLRIKHERKLQRELAAVTKLQQQIFDNVNIPLVLINPQGKVVAANPKALKKNKIKMEDLIGMDCCSEICHASERPEWCPLHQDGMWEKTRQVEVRDLKGGACLVTAQPIYSADHTLSYILESYVDITDVIEERKQALDLLENQRAVNLAISAMFIGNSVKLLEDTLTIIGERLGASRCYLLKYDFEHNRQILVQQYSEDESKPWPVGFSQELLLNSALCQKHMKLGYLALPNVDKSELKGMMESMHTNLPGRAFKSMYAAGVKVNGKQYGAIVVAYEEQTCTLNQHELNFLEEMARVFGIAQERIDRQNQLIMERDNAIAAEKSKSLFFSTVSHDIRTPLNAIIGFSELLKADAEDHATRAKYLDSIIFSSKTLLDLVNDLLDLSKLEADKMEILPARCDFVDLVKNLMSAFALQAEKKGIDLLTKLQDIPTVTIDQQRIRQIVFNLIGNAMKFTTQGSITLEASFTKDTDEYGVLHFAVTDTGAGIPEDKIPDLMKPFTQANVAHQAMGTGLGLAICKQLLDRMDGELKITSKVGAGSTFAVEMRHVNYDCGPVAVERKEEKNASMPQNYQSLVILTVDDSPVNLVVLGAMLKRMGVTYVLQAKSGQEALELLDGNKVDLVLTDMWMPGMDGAELVSHIRADERFAMLPVYAVTADVEAQKDYQSKGFTGILLKPLTIEQVQQCLVKLTG